MLMLGYGQDIGPATRSLNRGCQNPLFAMTTLKCCTPFGETKPYSARCRPPVPDSPLLLSLPAPAEDSSVLVPPVNPLVTAEILELIWSVADLSASLSPA